MPLPTLDKTKWWVDPPPVVRRLGTWHAVQHTGTLVPVGEAVAEGVPPGVSNGASLVAPVADATAAGIAPGIRSDSTVVVPCADATAAGVIPASVGGGSGSIAPVADATASGLTGVTYRTDHNVAAPLALSTADGVVPDIQVGVNAYITTPVADAIAAGVIPVVGGGSGSVVPVADATADGIIPLPVAGSGIDVPVADSTADGIIPTIGLINPIDQSDDFNYAGQLAAVKPTFWKAVTATPTTSGSVRYQAVSSARSAAGTVFECSSDRLRIDTVFSTRTTGKSAVMLCANAAFTFFVYLEFETGTFTNMWHIVTSTSTTYNQGGYTRRNSVNADSASGVQCGFQYDINENAFRSYRNGVLVNTWVDSGNVVPHGAGNRYGGLIVDTESGGNLGVSFDSFRMRDL